jgi:hypothetical protein
MYIHVQRRMFTRCTAVWLAICQALQLADHHLQRDLIAHRVCGVECQHRCWVVTKLVSILLSSSLPVTCRTCTSSKQFYSTHQPRRVVQRVTLLATECNKRAESMMRLLGSLFLHVQASIHACTGLHAVEANMLDLQVPRVSLLMLLLRIPYVRALWPGPSQWLCSGGACQRLWCSHLQVQQVHTHC